MKHIALFREILKDIVDEVYLEEIRSTVVQFIKDEYKPKSCAIVTCKDDQLRVRISRGVSYTFIKQLHRENRHPLVDFLRKEKKVVIIDENHPMYPTGFEHSYKTMVLVPILGGGRLVGLLFMDFSERKDFPPHEVEALETLGLLLSVAVDHYELRDRLDDLVDHDALTGVYNFKHFHELLFKEVQRTDETGHPFALGLYAVTGLKRVNEKYGHVAGDRLLRFVADLLKAKVRRFDAVARYAAAKFAVIFPEADKEFAKRIAEEVIEKFSKSEWARLDTEVYLDVGIVVYPEDAKDEKTLLNRLEECVHEAKRDKGSNIVVYPFK